MTVDDDDMNERVRATHVHDDNAGEEQQWRELPGLTYGKRENWMADRAKNVLGTAKLASLYLDQERGRINRLRKIKSVLALENFSGKNINRRRHRSYPIIKSNHRRNKSHRLSSATYRKLLPEGSLPSLTSRYLNRSLGNASLNGLPTVPLGRRSSPENIIGEGTQKGNYVRNGENAAPASGWDLRERVNPPVYMALDTKGDKRRGKSRRAAKSTDQYLPYVPGGSLDYGVHRGLKDGHFQPVCTPYDVVKCSSQVINFGPSAIDIFDQHERVTEPGIDLEEEVGPPQQSNSRAASDFSGTCPASDKPADDRDLLTPTISEVLPLPLPEGASSDLRGVRGHEEPIRCNQTRLRDIAVKNQATSARRPYASESDSSAAASLGSQYQTSPERLGDLTEINKNVRISVNETAESGNLDLHQSNPALVETKVSTKCEGGRRGSNTFEASPPPLSPKAPNYRGGAKGTLSGQRLTDPLAQLQKNKDLDALKSEYMEALSILQSIDCPSSTEPSNTNCEDNKKGYDVPAETARMKKDHQEQIEPATKSPGDMSAAPDSSAALPKGWVIPSNKGVEALSANLPRLGSREQNALRLLYRKWWVQLARGGRVSCLPEPGHFSPGDGPTQVVGNDGRTELIKLGGGEKGERNPGSQKLAEVELKQYHTKDASTTGDHVTIATDVKFLGSVGDVTTSVFTSLGVGQASAGEARDKRPISSGKRVERSFEVNQCPQVNDECTRDTMYMTPVSPPTSIRGTTDDIGHTSNCRTKARATSLGTAPGLVQSEQTSDDCSILKASSLVSAAAHDEPSEYTGNQSNEALGKLGTKDEQTVPRCSQDAAPKYVDVSTKTESTGSLININGSLSASPGVQLVSKGVGTDERRRNSTKATQSISNVSRCSRDAESDTEVVTSVTSVSRSTSRQDATDDSISCDRTSIDFAPGADFAQYDPSGYTGNQSNQTLNDAKRGGKNKHAVSRCSEDTTPVKRRIYNDARTKAESPGSGDATESASEAPWKRMTPVKGLTDERRRSGARAARRGSSAGHPDASRNTEADNFMTLMPPPSATDDVGHTNHGQTRVKSLGCASEADLMPKDPSGCTGNQPNQASSDARPEKGSKQAVPRCTQDVITAYTRKDDTNSTEEESPRRFDNAMGGPSALLAVNLYSTGVQTDEGCGSGTKAPGSTSNIWERSHIASIDAKTAKSMTSASPPPCTLDATDDPDHTIPSDTEVRTIISGSGEELDWNNSTAYTNSDSNQTSSDASREKEDEKIFSRCFQDASTASAQDSIADSIKVGSPERLGDTMKEPFASLGVQLTSVGTETGEIHRSGEKGTTSTLKVGAGPQVMSGGIKAATYVAPLSPRTSSQDATNNRDHTSRDRSRTRSILFLPAVSGTRASGRSSNVGEHSKVAGSDIEAATSVTPVSPPTRTRDVTYDPGYTNHGCTRANDVISGSTTGLAWYESSECTGNQPYQTSSDTRRGKEEKHIVPTWSSDVNTTSTRNNFVISIEAESPGRLGGIIGERSAPIEVQLLTVEVGTGKSRRSNAMTEGSNANVCTGNQVVSRDTEAVTYVGTSARDTIDNSDHTSHDRTRARAIISGSATDLTWHEPSVNMRNQPNQAPNGDNESKELGQALPRYSQDAHINTVFTREDITVSNDTESSGRLGDIMGKDSAPPGEQLISITFETDGRRHNDTRSTGSCLNAGSCHKVVGHEYQSSSNVVGRPQIVSMDTETTMYVTLVSPPKIRDTTDDPGHHGRARKKVNISSTAVGLARHKPWGHTGNRPNEILEDTSLGEKEGTSFARCFQDSAIVSLQKNIAASTEAESPGRLSGVIDVGSARLGVQLSSLRVETDERHRSSIRAKEKSLKVEDDNRVASGDPEAVMHVTNLSPPTSTQDTPNYPDCTIHDHTQPRATRSGPVADLPRHETLIYTKNQPNQVSSDKKRGKEEEQIMQNPQGLTIAFTRENGAILTEPDSSTMLGGMAERSSSFLQAKPKSKGIEAKEIHRNSQITSRNTKVASFVTPVSLHTSTRDTPNKTDHFSHHHARSRTFSSSSEIDLLKDSRSEYPSNQSNQFSSGAGRRQEKKHGVLGCSQDVTTASTRPDVYVSTEAGSPGRLGDIMGKPSATLAVQISSLRVETAKRRRCGIRAKSRSSNVGEGTSVANGDREDVAYVTPISLPTSIRDATDNPDCIIHPLPRARAIIPDSFEHLVGHKPSVYMRDQTNQSLNDNKRGKEEEYATQIYSQDAITNFTQEDVPILTVVESPRKLADIEGESASFGVKLTSIGVGTNERRRSGARAMSSGSNIGGYLHVTSGNTEAEPSKILVSHPTSTKDAFNDPDRTTHGSTRVRPINLDRTADFGWYKPPRFVTNQPDQASKYVKQSKGEEGVVRRYSQGTTTVFTREDVTLSIKVESPKRFGDIIAGSSSFFDGKPTSRGVETNEIHRSGTRTETSGSIVGGRPQVASRDTEAATPVTPVSSAATTRGTIDDIDHTNHGHTKVRSSSSNSAIYMAQHNPSKYTRNQSNQFSGDVRRGKEENYAAPGCPQGNTIASMRLDVDLPPKAEPPRRFDDIMGKAPPLGAHMTSVGINTDERRRSGARAIERSSKVGGISQDTNRNVEAAASMPPVSLSITTEDNTDNTNSTSHSTTNLKDSSSSSARDLAWRVPSGNPSVQSNQFSTEARRGKEEKHAVVRGSQDVITAFPRPDVDVSTKAKSPGRISDIMEKFSSPLRVHLTSVGVNTDERHRSGVNASAKSPNVGKGTQVASSDVRAATPVTSISPPICTRSVTDDPDYTIHDCMSTRAIISGSAANVSSHDQSRCTRNSSSQFSSDARREKEETYTVPRLSKDVTTASTHANVDVSAKAGSPGRLGGIIGKSPAAFEVQLTSKGADTGERRRSGVKTTATSANLDNGTQVTGSDAEAAPSLNPISPSNSSRDVTDDPDYIIHNHPRVRAIRSVSVPDFVVHDTRYQPKHSLNDDKRMKEDEQAVQIYSQDVPTIFALEYVAVSTEVESPRKLAHIMEEDSLSINTKSIMDDADHTMKVRAIRSGSGTDLAWHEPSGYEKYQLNQALGHPKPEKEDEHAVVRYSHIASTAFMRKDDTVSIDVDSRGGLGGVAGSLPAFLGVQSSSIRVETSEIRLSGVMATESSWSIGGHPQVASRDVGAETCATLVSPPTRTRDALHGPDLDNHSCTRSRAIESNLIAEFAWHEPSTYTSGEPNYTSRGTNGGKEVEQAGPKYPQDITTASTQPNVAVSAGAEVPRNLCDTMGEPSASLGVQSISIETETDERGRSGVDTTEISLTLCGYAQVASRDVKAATSENPVSLPSRTRDTLDNAYHTSHGRTRKITAIFGSAAGVVRYKPPVYTEYQSSQTSNDANRWKGENQVVSRYPHDVNTVFKQDYIAFAAEVRSPGSIGDIMGGGSASFGEQLTLVGAGAEEAYLSSVRATVSSSGIGRCPKIVSRDTKVATYVTAVSPLISIHDATDACSYNIRSCRRYIYIGPGWTTDVARYSHSIYTGIQPNQALRDAKRREEEEQAVLRLSQEASISFKEKHIALVNETELPRRLGDVLGNISASLDVPLISVGVATDERYRSGVRFVRSSWDAGKRRQVTGRDAGAEASVALVSPHISTHDAKDGTDHASHGSARSQEDSTVDFARYEPSMYPGNQPNQASNDITQGKEDGEAVSKYFRSTTTAFTRKYATPSTSAESLMSFGGNIMGPSVPLGVQLTSVGVWTGEILLNDGRAPSGGSNISGSLKIASRNAAAVTFMTLLSPPTRIRTAAGGLDHASRVLTRARAIYSISSKDFSQHDISGYMGNQFNHTLSGASQGQEEKQAVSRCPQDTTTFLAKKDVAILTKLEPLGSRDVTTRRFAHSAEVQLTSIGVGTYEIRSSYVNRHPWVTSKGVKAETPVAPILLRTRLQDATFNTGHTIPCLTTAKEIISGSAVEFTQHKPLKYIGNQPNQALNDAKRERAVQKCSLGVTTAVMLKDVAVSTKAETPGGLVDVASRRSASLGIPLNLEGVGADKRVTESNSDTGWRPQIADKGTGVATSVALVSPLSFTCSAAHNDHHNICGQRRAIDISLGSAVGLARNEPLRGASNDPKQILNVDSEGGKENQHMPGIFQTAYVAPKKNYADAATEAQSPRSVGDITTTCFVSSGVKLKSSRIGTNKPCRSGASITRSSSSINRRPQGAREDTESAISVTLVSQYIKRQDVTDDPDHTTNCGRTRARYTNPDVTADYARHVPWEYKGNHPSKTVSNISEGKRQENDVSCSEQAITALARNDIVSAAKAVLPGRLGGIIGEGAASFGVQLTSVGVETVERCYRGEKATEKSSDAAQGAGEGTAVATSVTLVPPPFIACSSPHDACHTIHGRLRARYVSLGSAVGLAWDDLAIHSRRMRARGLSLDSEASLARNKSLVYTKKQSNETLTDARRWKGGKQVMSQRSQTVTTILTQNCTAVEMDAESPRSLNGVTKSPSTYFEVQLTSVMERTKKKRHSATGAATSVTLVSPPPITRDTPHDVHPTTHGRTKVKTPSFGLAAELTRDDHTSYGRRTRASAVSSDSAAGLARNEFSGYMDNQSNQALRGNRRGKGEKGAVSRCPQDVAMNSTQTKVAITNKAESRGSIGNTVWEGSTSLGVQLTSIGTGTEERRRSGMMATGNSSDVDRRPKVTGDNAQSTTSVTQEYISLPIVTHSATHKAHQTSRGGNTNVISINSSSQADFACHKPLGYMKDTPNQALVESSGRKKEKQAVPRCSRDVTIAFTRKDVAVGTETESPESLDNVTESSSTFPGVQLTSAGIRPGEINCGGLSGTGSSSDVGGCPQIEPTDGEAATSVTTVPPSTSSRDVTDNPNHSSSGRKRARYVISGLAPYCPLHNPWGYKGHQLNQSSSNARSGKWEEKAVSRHSKDVMIVTGKEYSVSIETESPWRPGDFKHIPSDSVGIQLTSVGVRADERCRSGTGVATSFTPLSPPMISRDAHHTMHGLSRARHISSVSAVDLYEARSSAMVVAREQKL